MISIPIIILIAILFLINPIKNIDFPTHLLTLFTIFIVIEIALIVIYPKEEISLEVNIEQCLEKGTIKDNSKIVEDMYYHCANTLIIKYKIIKPNVKNYSIISRSLQNELIRGKTLKTTFK